MKLLKYLRDLHKRWRQRSETFRVICFIVIFTVYAVVRMSYIHWYVFHIMRVGVSVEFSDGRHSKVCDLGHPADYTH